MYYDIKFFSNEWHYQKYEGGIWVGGFPTYAAALNAALQSHC